MYELPDDSGELIPHPCQHEGCDVQNTLACYVPTFYLTGDPAMPAAIEPDAWYCGAHAPIHGFCSSCGEYHGGEEGFENSSLCDMCASEQEYERARDQQLLLQDGDFI